MAIRIHFPNPDDSPTGRTPLRVRYALQPAPGGGALPVLHYGHGTATLSPAAWAGFRAVGATLSTDTDRERSLLREVLGEHAA